MKLNIVNSNVVTGDGVSFLEDTSVVIEDGFISDLPRIKYIPYSFYIDEYINAQGGLVIPGLMDIHTHGTSFGPFLPYAWKRLSAERILFNLNTHLLEGTTTVMDADGWSLPFEVDAINKIHPMNVKTATLYTPKNMRAAEIIAGDGLDEFHRKMTAEEAVQLGAVAIGEIGSPGTTAGTAEKRKRLGKIISVVQARALDNAVVADDSAQIRKVLKEIGFEKMTIDEAKKLVEETSLIPIQACCDAIRESTTYVKKLGVPAHAHSEPGMKEALLDVAEQIGPELIAAHANHSFTLEENIKFAIELKRLGATVEAISADYFGAKQVEPSPATTFALFKEGLVDVLATDFSGGYHEPMLSVLQKAIEEKALTLPKAIQLVTSNVAKAVPRLAPHRGLIEVGKVADLCIVDKNDISKIKYVLIAGRVVVKDGRIVA